ncbi:MULTISPECIES: tRNA pseudouridine(55) synthase TruB [Legionella]|uniref:tRNA pseudouridine synthase B n=1 Tax=Legionella resiliens TaxID=2905958 RepID=A0ABS8X0D6_9GAMM|nr:MULTISPECIES: tRNA pseudouridine(55) synthase TruB [unclassified Legionella]MCE0722303.1 tRNA pseudouridine(55) synthase TruB [Legionella sp. 9fVS26]MCE3531457.1 tRNA pseudouridine(55) synthase TruB [Legionella sp. 8cVS16]QLZ67477.1 tRNA pseudouridine(55) synthase TruB [Legionella sp. PC1000]
MNAINPLIKDGILLLNKSEGMTSNTALQKAKKLLGAQKAGHTGSLDPLATGMLPLCFGEGTKVCQFLLDADKCYQTIGLLGIKTNTADATGEVIARAEAFTISEESLLHVLMQHTGYIKQIPSMFSALKHNGVPLYRLARKGINIERTAREILISNLQLNAFDGIQFSLTVTCSKGTYIRNLVEDIGDALGVGAHVTQLHRVHTSGLENMPMYSLDELESMSMSERVACLIPMDRAVDHFEPVTLSDDELLAIRQGRVVTNKLEVEITDCVRLYDKEAQFIGLGERNTQGTIKAKRLLSF